MSDRLKIITGDCRTALRVLPDKSVHCCVTSPPYWGLRDYGHADQIGLEPTPEAFVENMLVVFREVWRVLRDDGTLWLNLGDSYNAQKGQRKTTDKAGEKQITNGGSTGAPSRYVEVLKPKDLVGIPWRVAFALQADGWYLRQDIIWHKPSCMPESVTDRCTKSHEYIFLLTKQERYFCDMEAIKEPSEYPDDDRKGRSYDHHKSAPTDERNGVRPGNYLDSGRPGYSMRNKRSVWSVTNCGYREAHFATFPPDLIKPCILAGTSASGCCGTCGSPVERIIQTSPNKLGLKNGGHREPGRDGGLTERTEDDSINVTGKTGESKTIGWEPTCKCCDIQSVKPCVVLDPFGGSGTTGMVSNELGRNAILCELNRDYVELIKQRTNVTPGLAL